MALSFIFGASGAGKSTMVYKTLLEQAEKDFEKQFYLIVPDQFTMQTQKELVESSRQHGILNIDILSFGRLSYRIIEETGGNEFPILDDTGKNLILRIVAAGISEQLPVLGSHIHQIGYIHEVKSAISEFMQYRIGNHELEELIRYASERKALTGKLQDLKLLYGGFINYIQDHYITTEETMEVLARKIPASQKLKDSVIAFDGFTGFTPVQLRVIEQLLVVAKEVVFSLIIDEKVNPFQENGEQKLFYLTQRTVGQLCYCAEKMSVKRGKDITILKQPVERFRNSPVLAHLERNLFRYPQQIFEEEVNGIWLTELSNPSQEVKYCARKIHRLVREEGYLYRDFAVVCGDLEGYASHIRNEFVKMKIPFFLDQTNGILMNPFVECIRSALLIKNQNFTVDAVNHYLRTGLTDFSVSDIDALDNYMRTNGIRGKSNWSKSFTIPPYRDESGEGFACLQRLNEVRQKMVEQMEPLLGMGESVSQKVRALYSFIVSIHVQEKLSVFEKKFEERGDAVRAREYHQIYPYIMDLLSQIENLSGTEKMSDKEFAELLDAGFSEMKVGTIPQNVDHIVVGDMERSRIHNVKVLFFLGVNDGNIPKHSDKGGIISDIDREFLQSSKWELAPSPRQKMYIQRLYLYMNMTKPSEKLILSYARTANDGKTMRPAYLINLLKKMFLKLHTDRPEEYSEYDQIETWEDGMQLLASELRRGAAGQLTNEETEDICSMFQIYQKVQKNQTQRIWQTAFIRYREIPLTDKLAAQLYGSRLLGSVTRIENFAACAYAHFLRFGLQLQERKELQFEASDLGTLFHGILAEFSRKLLENGYKWHDFPEEEGIKILDAIIESNAAAYGNAILYQSARNIYALQRMKRIMRRSIMTIQYQLQQGEFEPEEFEMPFQVEEENILMVGRIDRLDLCKEGDICYLKVMDYKSGKTQFDMTAYHNGLQLQLMTYLYAAMQYEEKKKQGKKIVPAGVLYYHIDDPIVELEQETPTEEIQEKIIHKLSLTGLVNNTVSVIEKIDHEKGTNLKVLPLSRKADGSFKSNSMLVTEDELLLLAQYAALQIKQLGDKILKGCIELNPYERKNSTACDYCPYAKICGFDIKIPGYEMKQILEEENTAVIEDICQKLSGKEEQDGN